MRTEWSYQLTNNRVSLTIYMIYRVPFLQRLVHSSSQVSARYSIVHFPRCLPTFLTDTARKARVVQDGDPDRGRVLLVEKMNDFLSKDIS